MTASERAALRQALSASRAAFQRSTARLDQLQSEEATLTTEIANLRKSISALAAICSEEPGLDKLGITESVLQVMRDTPFTWSTGEVVNALHNMGFDVTTQKNIQASVHAVLARLAARDQISRVAGDDAMKNSDGQLLEWRGPKYDPAQDNPDIPF